MSSADDEIRCCRTVCRAHGTIMCVGRSCPVYLEREPAAETDGPA